MPWSPAHPNHAIERVTVLFQFGENVPSRLWESILAQASERSSALGFTSAVDEMEMNFMPLPVGQPAPGAVFPQMFFGHGGGNQPAQTRAGRTFQVIEDGVVREQLSLRRNLFFYSIPTYTSWIDLRDRIQNLVSSYLDSVMASISLSTMKLEYWDRFVFEGAEEGLSYSELFREGSRNLPAFPFGLTDLWHSHVGYFIPSNSAARRLFNLNVDMVEGTEPAQGLMPPTPRRRSAGLYSMVQDSYEAQAAPPNWTAMSLILDEMHGILNASVSDTITDGMASMINLNAQGES